MERWTLNDRQVLIESVDETIRVGFWPELDARYWDGFGEQTWEEVWPEMRLIHPVRRKRHSKWKQLEFPFDDERRPTEDDLWREATEAFRNAVPSELARVVEPFHWGQWALLRACRDAPRYLDLIRSNPVLAMMWLLNEPEEFAGPDDLHTVSGTSQRRLLEDLGAEGRKSTLKILRRIVVPSFDQHMNRMLGQIITDKDTLARLSHLPRIGRGVLALAEWPDMLELCSPSLLLEVSSSKKEIMSACTAGSLHDYLSNCEKLGLEPKGISTRWEAEKLAARTSWALGEARRRGQQLKTQGTPRSYRPFPPPPFPGTKTIEPITSRIDLTAEGNHQRNCLMNPNSGSEHIRKVLTKRFFFYRVSWPERCTLLIGKSRQGKWQRMQLLASGNQHPKRSTKRHIDTWLKRSQRDQRITAKD